MTNIKLLDNATLTCKTVEIQNGTLILETTTDKSAEDLHRIFSNKSNLNIIELQTQSGSTLGNKYGFVCYAGITLLEDGSKRIELIQEKDPTEQRLTRAETQAMQAVQQATTSAETATQAKEQVNRMDAKILDVRSTVDQALLELTIAIAQQDQQQAEEGGKLDVQ